MSKPVELIVANVIQEVSHAGSQLFVEARQFAKKVTASGPPSTTPFSTDHPQLASGRACVHRAETINEIGNFALAAAALFVVPPTAYVPDLTVDRFASATAWASRKARVPRAGTLRTEFHRLPETSPASTSSDGDNWVEKAGLSCGW